MHRRAGSPQPGCWMAISVASPSARWSQGLGLLERARSRASATIRILLSAAIYGCEHGGAVDSRAPRDDGGRAARSSVQRRCEAGARLVRIAGTHDLRNGRRAPTDCPAPKITGDSVAFRRRRKRWRPIVGASDDPDPARRLVRAPIGELATTGEQLRDAAARLQADTDGICDLQAPRARTGALGVR